MVLLKLQNRKKMRTPILFQNHGIKSLNGCHNVIKWFSTFAYLPVSSVIWGKSAAWAIRQEQLT